MPPSTEQILAHADQLARRLARHEPAADRVKDAGTLRDIAAEVAVARGEGHTWAAIGAMLGTSGEARQRYGSGAA